MQRELARPLVLALLCLVAVAVASATLTNPVDTVGTGYDQPGEGVGRDDGAWNPFTINTTDETDTSDAGGGTFGLASVCVSFLRTAEFALLALVALLVLSAALYRKARGIGVAAGLAAVLPPGFIVYSFLTSCTPDRGGPGGFGFEQGNASEPSLGAGTGGGGGSTVVEPPVALLVVAGVLAVVLVAALVRSTGDDAVEEPPVPEPDPADDALAAVGDVAGEAADRIEAAADLENEVFRAWREMTDLLDVDNPRSSTPAEFETAASRAGMDPEHVAELTDLFREVRYGGVDPTPDREERAVAALRAIEGAYADEEGEP